jgi:hypothetical protein
VSWYRLKNAAGEIRFAASLDGEDTAKWTPLAIDRCPEPYETVADDGTISADATEEADINADAQLGRMRRLALMRFTVRTAKSQLIDDMLAVGVITQAQAVKLKARL